MISELPAFTLAAEWHAGQCRKGCKKEPFVNHPLRVAGILIEHGYTQPELIQAALLHDVLEDTACPEELIREKFGDQVLEWVKEVTDRKELLKSERKQHQVERAEMLSPEAKLIRLADKIDNVESMIDDPPDNWSWQRRREYQAWADRVVKALGPMDESLSRRYRACSAAFRRMVTGT